MLGRQHQHTGTSAAVRQRKVTCAVASQAPASAVCSRRVGNIQAGGILGLLIEITVGVGNIHIVPTGSAGINIDAPVLQIARRDRAAGHIRSSSTELHSAFIRFIGHEIILAVVLDYDHIVTILDIVHGLNLLKALQAGHIADAAVAVIGVVIDILKAPAGAGHKVAVPLDAVYVILGEEFRKGGAVGVRAEIIDLIGLVLAGGCVGGVLADQHLAVAQIHTDPHDASLQLYHIDGITGLQIFQADQIVRIANHIRTAPQAGHHHGRQAFHFRGGHGLQFIVAVGGCTHRVEEYIAIEHILDSRALGAGGDIQANGLIDLFDKSSIIILPSGGI